MRKNKKDKNQNKQTQEVSNSKKEEVQLFPALTEGRSNVGINGPISSAIPIPPKTDKVFGYDEELKRWGYLKKDNINKAVTEPTDQMSTDIDDGFFGKNQNYEGSYKIFSKSMQSLMDRLDGSDGTEGALPYSGNELEEYGETVWEGYVPPVNKNIIDEEMKTNSNSYMNKAPQSQKYHPDRNLYSFETLPQKKSSQPAKIEHKEDSVVFNFNFSSSPDSPKSSPSSSPLTSTTSSSMYSSSLKRKSNNKSEDNEYLTNGHRTKRK